MNSEPEWAASLWDHQKAAVGVFSEYLGRGPGNKAALVSMPTGTGKSAVIASLLADPRNNTSDLNILVIAPWKGLAAQLREDIDSKVWQHLGVNRPQTLPRVLRVQSAADFTSRVGAVGSQPTVYVTTMAMVVQILKEVDGDPIEMGSLFTAFSYVVVDECHYEPAPTWSVAVRATGLPTCLMTATPFRNDNKFFELDDKAQFRYSHRQAVKDVVLREPQFHVLGAAADETAFAEALCKRLNTLRVPKSARVVVRCSSRASVEAMVGALRDLKEEALGFHETFDSTVASDGLLQSVPPPSKRPQQTRFWVHQHKLTEGFDHPNLTVLAVYEGFGNDRSRIQQIGRVLRNGDRLENAKAHVLAFDQEFKSAWERYRRFDDVEAPRAVATDPAGIEALLEAQPESFYWDRLFRDQVELHGDDAWQHIRFRLSASVRSPKGPPDLGPLMSAVQADHVERDRRVLSVTAPDPNTRVLVYLSVENSPVLLTGAFVEMSLGYTLVHWDGKRLFVSDSGSVVPKCVRDSTRPLEAKALVGLLPDEARISNVSLVNNDLGPWSVRARSLTAPDLSRIAPETGESTYGYATATGYMTIAGDAVTRYAGVKNGRVRDQRPSEGRLEDALAWFAEIGDALDGGGAPSRVIARYSSPVAPPEKSVPTHALLDIDPDDFEPLSGAAPLTVEGYGGPVSEDGTFEVTIAGEVIKVGIRWSDEAQRFELSPGSHVPYRSRHGALAMFWHEVERSRSLQVADDSGVVYSNGNFWSLELTGRGSAHGLLSVLKGVDSLDTSTGEKGDVVGDKWESTSVFGIIDEVLLPSAFVDTPTILCTDMGTEIADFVGFSDSKVVFVHAKGKKQDDKSYVSATSFHELVAQAMKNMKYLAIGNEDKPSTASWTNEWTDGTHGHITRHRSGQKSSTGDAYWKRINRVVQSHGAEKEVWLVLGASLSLSRLEKALKKPKPSGVAVAMHALLSSAWSTSQQYGVRLRIFCSP
jgi:hypothetical protein